MKIFTCFLWLAFSFTSFPEGSGDMVTVKLKITNVENDGSNIMVAVFSGYDTFLTEDMYRTEVIPVENFTETEIELSLEKGEYAIAVFQDSNKNGDLDKNIFSYPSEPFGFSNNYRPLFQAPHWTDVAFQADRDRVLEIGLN